MYFWLKDSADLASGNTGAGHKGPPYARIAKDQSRYIAAQYVPTGFVLIEPRNLKQADGFAFLKHIAERQLTHAPAEVFRFSRVEKSRKAQDADGRRQAKYPADASGSDASSEAAPVPKVRKPRKTKKAAPKVDRAALALQKDMEGLHDAAETVEAEAEWGPEADRVPEAQPRQEIAPSGPVENSDADHTAPDKQVGPRYYVTYGPNDPVPLEPGVQHIPLHGQQQQSVPMPMAGNPIPLYPAGIPPEFIGVIDPALIGLRADPPQLLTPRPSVTPNLSPVKPAAPAVTEVATPGSRSRVMMKIPTLPSIAESSGSTLKPFTKTTIRPRPRGKASQMVVRSTGLATPTATTATSQSTADIPVSPSKAEGVRRTADVLAAEEANQLTLPAKRVRTPKVRTT